jgi:hypothetical protein
VPGELTRGSTPREDVLEALVDGPKSSRELGVGRDILRSLEADGLVEFDPDRFPDDYVPGNPLIARLPGDEREWPGWARWNV